jgi:hypothetical protein
LFLGLYTSRINNICKKLYLKSGGINKKFKYAGDFDLWKRFSNYSDLISAEIKIGVFRKRVNQLSSNQKAYLKEVYKTNCLIPFGKVLRFLYSNFVNFLKKFSK